jgi:hypothetical protein
MRRLLPPLFQRFARFRWDLAANFEAPEKKAKLIVAGGSKKPRKNPQPSLRG